jgi:uncharacterized protein YuzE
MTEIRYTQSSDAAYIRLRQGAYSESVSNTDDLTLDIDAQGYVLGIEILNASTFFSDLNRGFGGKLELPERIDPKTFDPATLFATHA